MCFGVEIEVEVNKTKLMLNSTQVEDVFEVGVELGNISVRKILQMKMYQLDYLTPTQQSQTLSYLDTW